jgi:hypothetical protein
MHYSCNIQMKSIEHYNRFFRPQQSLVDEYVFWGIVNATVCPSRVMIFFRALYFIPSRVAIALLVVFLTQVKYRSELTLHLAFLLTNQRITILLK